MSKNPPHKRNSKKVLIPGASNRLYMAILVVMVFVFYGNSLNNGYSLDDDLVTTTDNRIHERVEQGIKGIPTIFKTHFVENPKQSYSYRPITTSSFAVEYQFFGNKPPETRARISHFINVFIYLIIILLIYHLVYKLLPDKSKLIPFLVAALFLIHPIHTEVVNNIKCRDELLVMLFGLLSALGILSYVDTGKKKWWLLLLSLGLMVLSVLSKRTGFVYVINIPLIIYFFRDVKLKQVAMFVGVLFVGVLMYSMLKKGAIETEGIREKMFFENPLYFADSFAERIPMFFYSIAFYVKMMLFPHPLVYYYGYDQVPIAGWDHPMVWLGVIFVLGVTGLALWRIKKKEMWAFGVLFFMFGIGGGANLLFPAVGIVAERFVFTASFGLIFVAGYYGYNWFLKSGSKPMRLLVYSIGGIVLLTSFAKVVDRNEDWESRISLYRNDSEYLENSAKAHSLLGTEYKEIADTLNRNPMHDHRVYLAYIDSAIYEFEQGVKVYDGYYNCANNAGVLYFRERYDHYKARELVLKALEYKPDYVEALLSLGSCYERDINGANQILHLVDAHLPDSLRSIPRYSEPYEDSLAERAGVTISILTSELQSILSRINPNDPNWKNVVKYHYDLIVERVFAMENGVLLESGGKEEVKRIVAEKITTIDIQNYAIGVNNLVAAVEGVLNKRLADHVQLSDYDANSLVTLRWEVLTYKYSLLDTVVNTFESIIKTKPDYYPVYNSLTNLYVREEMYEDVIDLNSRAILEGYFPDNTEFYTNIGSAYNAKQDYTAAIANMDNAIQEIDRLYSEAYYSEEMNAEDKNTRLNFLLQRKKKIYGFMSNIYFSIGEMEKAEEYRNLSASI